MSDRHHRDSAEPAELTEHDLAVATLVGRYIERREHHETPRVHDLLAAAAEFGDTAVDVLRTVLACYEACAPTATTTSARRATGRHLRASYARSHERPGTQPHRR
jgi:hypothetical protein